MQQLVSESKMQDLQNVTVEASNTDDCLTVQARVMTGIQTSSFENDFSIHTLKSMKLFQAPQLVASMIKIAHNGDDLTLKSRVIFAPQGTQLKLDNDGDIEVDKSLLHLDVQKGDSLFLIISVEQQWHKGQYAFELLMSKDDVAFAAASPNVQIKTLQNDFFSFKQHVNNSLQNMTESMEELKKLVLTQCDKVDNVLKQMNDGKQDLKNFEQKICQTMNDNNVSVQQVLQQQQRMVEDLPIKLNSHGMDMMQQHLSRINFGMNGSSKEREGFVDNMDIKMDDNNNKSLENGEMERRMSANDANVEHRGYAADGAKKVVEDEIDDQLIASDWWEKHYDAETVFKGKSGLDNDVKPPVQVRYLGLRIFECTGRASRFDKQTEAWRKRGWGKLELYFDKKHKLLTLLFEDDNYRKFRLKQTFVPFFDYNMNWNDEEPPCIEWENKDYVMPDPVSAKWKVMFNVDAKRCTQKFVAIIKNFYWGLGLPSWAELAAKQYGNKQ